MMSDPNIPDDLSDMPPDTLRIKMVGDTDTALTAAMDQVLQYLKAVSARLFFLHMTTNSLDADNPQDAVYIQELAQEAFRIVWELPEQYKVILIGMIMSNLVASADQAVEAGWIPSDEELDNPEIRDKVMAATGASMETLKKLAAQVRARRAVNEGAPPPQPSATSSDPV